MKKRNPFQTYETFLFLTILRWDTATHLLGFKKILIKLRLHMVEIWPIKHYLIEHDNLLKITLINL